MWIVLAVVVLIVLDGLLQGLMFLRMRRLQRRYDLLSAEYDLLADHYRLLIGFTNADMMIDEPSLVPEPAPPSRMH